MWSFLTLPLNGNLICVASQHIIPTLRLFLKTFQNFLQGKNNFPWESHGIPMGIPWEIWNSKNNNQQHNYKVYRLSTSAVNRFCICLSNLHISYTLQVPQKRYIGTFKSSPSFLHLDLAEPRLACWGTFGHRWNFQSGLQNEMQRWRAATNKAPLQLGMCICGPSGKRNQLWTLMTK